MNFLLLLSLLYVGAQASDTLYNTKKVNLIAVSSPSTRDTLSKMIKNEKTAKELFPSEVEDLKNIRSLNRSIAGSIIEANALTKKNSNGIDVGGKITTKKTETNFIISEDFSVIASADKSTH